MEQQQEGGSWVGFAHGWGRTFMSAGKLATSFTLSGKSLKLAQGCTLSGVSQLALGLTLVPTAGFIAKQTGWYDEKEAKRYAGYFVEGVSAVCDPVGYSIGKGVQYVAGKAANAAIDYFEIENEEIRDTIKIAASEGAGKVAAEIAEPVNKKVNAIYQEGKEQLQMKIYGKATKTYTPGEKPMGFSDGYNKEEYVVEEKTYPDGSKKIKMASGIKIKVAAKDAPEVYQQAKQSDRAEFLVKNNARLAKTPGGVEIKMGTSQYEDKPYAEFMAFDKDLKSIHSDRFYPDEVNLDFSKWTVLKLKSGEEVLKDPNGMLHPTKGFSSQYASRNGFSSLKTASGETITSNSKGWEKFAEPEVPVQRQRYMFFKPEEQPTNTLLLKLAKMGHSTVKLYCDYRIQQFKLNELMRQAEQQQRQEELRRDTQQTDQQVERENRRQRILILQRSIQSTMLRFELELYKRLNEIARLLPANSTEPEVLAHYTPFLKEMGKLLCRENAQSPLRTIILSVIDQCPPIVKQKFAQESNAELNRNHVDSNDDIKLYQSGLNNSQRLAPEQAFDDLLAGIDRANNANEVIAKFDDLDRQMITTLNTLKESRGSSPVSRAQSMGS